MTNARKKGPSGWVIAAGLFSGLTLIAVSVLREKPPGAPSSGVDHEPAGVTETALARPGEAQDDPLAAEIASAPMRILERTAVAAPNGSPEVALAEDLRLNVLALGPEGDPAGGLEVALRMLLPDGTVRTSPDVATTDTEGRASFPWERALLLGADKAGIEARIVSQQRPVAAPSDQSADGPPIEAVVLRLPPTASVEIRTWLAPGEPLPLHGQARLMTSLASGTPRAFASAPVRQGIARFEYVDPKVGYDVEVSGSIPWDPVRIDGPLTPGRTVAVDVYPRPSCALYGARLLADTGEPLTNFEITLRLDQGTQGTSAVSDYEGRISLGLPSEKVGAAVTATVEPKSWSIPHGQPIELEIPAAGAGQRVDLGDIVLEKPVAWYSGTVVDVGGAPVTDATVALDLVQGQGEAQRAIRRASSTGTNGQGRFWLPAPDPTVIGMLEPPDTALRLEARGFYVSPATVEVAAQPVEDLRLVLAPLREVSLLVGHAAPPSSPLQVVAKRSDQPDADHVFFGRRLGSPELRANLPAGTWTLSFYLGPYSGLPIFESAPFTVERPTDAESVAPEELRLPDISLEGRWRSASLRFENESGLRVSGVDLRLRSASVAEEGFALAGGDTDLELVLPSGPISITAKAKGYRERTFTLVGTKRTVTLEPEGR